MRTGAQQLKELECAFEVAVEATEHLLGEYALFVLEHEEVIAFLEDYLRALRYNFGLALRNFDARQAERLLDDLQRLFGEAQLKVNRSIIPTPPQVGRTAPSKTIF